MLRIAKIIFMAMFIFVFSHTASAQYNRVNTLQFINKTSFIIGEAYDMAYYYNYYSSGYLSKAINNQQYAKWLFNLGNYRKSVIYSNIARRYALHVIYSCDNYWTNYYFPTYYSHYDGNGNHRGYRNNRRNNSPNYNHRDNTGGGSYAPNGTPRRTSNSEYDRYYASVNNSNEINERTFEDWEKAYYSYDERDFVKELPVALDAELTAELEKSPITAYREDKEIVTNVMDDFKGDIDSYKTSHTEEARQIAIARPTDFNVTETETRESAGKQLYPKPEATNAATINSSTSTPSKTISTTSKTTPTTSKATPTTSKTTTSKPTTSTSTSTSTSRTTPKTTTTTSKATPTTSKTTTSNRNTSKSSSTTKTKNIN